MLVCPALPIAQRHNAEESVRGVESRRIRNGQPLQTGNCPLSIRVKNRRLRPPGSWIVQRVCLPTVRPPKRSPEANGFHHPTVPLGNRFFPFSDEENHFNRVAQMAEHLVRGECPPPAREIRCDGRKPHDEAPQNVRIPNRFHSTVQSSQGFDAEIPSRDVKTIELPMGRIARIALITTNRFLQCDPPYLEIALQWS